MIFVIISAHTACKTDIYVTIGVHTACKACKADLCNHWCSYSV